MRIPDQVLGDALDQVRREPGPVRVFCDGRNIGDETVQRQWTVTRFGHPFWWPWQAYLVATVKETATGITIAAGGYES